MPKESSSKKPAPARENLAVKDNGLSPTPKKPKESSSKKPAAARENPAVKENGPSPTPKKPFNEIDEIFAAKKRKKSEQEKAEKQVEDESAKAKKPKKKKNKKIEPKEKEYRDPPSRPRKKTGDGLVVYTEEELGFGKSDAGGMESCETVNVRWNKEVDKSFIETCVQEVTKNGRRGGSLRAESWTTVMEVLKANHNFVVSQKQMKNRYDYLKRKHQAWLTLVTKTSHVYDHGTNTINASNTEWKEYIKAHPEAKSLRFAPLPYPELCTIIFGGAIVTGVDANSEDQALFIGSSSSSKCRNEEQLNNEVINVDEQEGNSEEEGNSDTSIPRIQSKASIPPSQGDAPEKKRKCQPSTSQTKFEEEMTYALSLMRKNHCGSTVTQCMAKLDEVGWDKEDVLYITAVVIFGTSAGHREAWMNLPNDNVRVLTAWIKRVGELIGLTF